MESKFPLLSVLFPPTGRELGAWLHWLTHTNVCQGKSSSPRVAVTTGPSGANTGVAPLVIIASPALQSSECLLQKCLNITCVLVTNLTMTALQTR